MVTGRDPDKLRTAVETLSRDGKAWGIEADLADRAQVPEVRKRLAAEHADGRLLVNGAGFFTPRAFTEYHEAFYDSFNELNRAMFSLVIELAPHAIRVNAVSIAAVKTPPYFRLVPEGDLDDPVNVDGGVMAGRN